MKEDVGEMMRAGVQAVELSVEHVGQPGDFTVGAAAEVNTNHAVTGVGFQPGQHFTAARVRILKIDVEWRTLVGAHTQRLDLITPDGPVYQRFNASVEGVDGRAIVETRLPVAGTWITEFSLEGQWMVNVYLDGAVTPIATATFTLSK